MENFGTLTDVRLIGGGYYKLVEGKNRDGQVRQVCTRGEGKEKAATRIPIRIEPQFAQQLMQEARGRRPGDFVEVMEGCGLRRYPLDRFSVLLVQMPREGNKVSGWEWNAPGGTGEPGETPEQIAQREFSEETDLTVLFTGSLVPPWTQYASGCYDEVQTISFALVTGSPQKLEEGARRWIAIPLGKFAAWAHAQNQLEDCSRWETVEFIPVDGKVVLMVLLLITYLRPLQVRNVRPLHPSEADPTQEPAAWIIQYMDCGPYVFVPAAANQN